jgi:Bacterial Ig-like domain
MPTENSEVGFRESRDRVRKKIRFTSPRESRLRAPILESLEFRMLLTVPAAPSTPTLVNDTGTFDNDDITNANNSAVSPAPSNAPVFDVAGVDPGASVVLYRNGMEVSQVAVGAGGIATIADLNGGDAPGQDPISNGIYVYRAQQIDPSGGASPLGGSLTITINASPPLAPPAPLLDPASDTSHGDDETTYDNNPILNNPPVFDVRDVSVGAGVILYRASVIGGVVGTFSQVNSLTDTSGGTVTIADVNGGGGPIPDGSYVYQARQIDVAGNVGPLSVDSTTITIDTTPPSPPSAPVLVAADDTGVSDSDDITAISHGGYPAFEVSGVEGNATLRLFRLAPGTSSPVLVDSVTEPPSATPLTISIADLAMPAPDGTYIYTAEQIDRAGNVSPMGQATSVTYDTATPPTPPAPVLDPSGTGNPPVTSTPTPTFKVAVSVSGLEADSSLSLVRDGTVVAQSAYDLTSGSVKITDPGPVVAGMHTYQVFLTDLAGNTSTLSAGTIVETTAAAPSTPTLVASSDSGTKGDGITNVTKNLQFDIAGAVPGDTVRLYRDGQLVATGIGPGILTDPGPLQPGKTYTYTAVQIDPDGTASPVSGAMPVTIVTQAVTPDLVGLDPHTDSGTLGDDITDVASNLLFDVDGVAPGATVELFRDSTMVNSVVSAAGGAITIPDPGPITPGGHAYAVAQVDAAGNFSPVSPEFDVWIVTPVATPGLALAPGSDSGTAGDDITDVDGSGGIFPTFDVANVAAGATLKLLRDGVVVQTLVDAPAGAAVLTDDNGGNDQSPGPVIPDGTDRYTLQQIDIYGDSATSAALTVQFLSRGPDPGTPVLAPGSDTGAAGDDITSVRSPVFNVPDVPAGDTLNLLRDGAVVAEVATGAGGTVAIGDPGPLADGTYSYAAEVVDGAGNVGPVSGSLPVSIVTVQGDYTGAGVADLAVFQRTDPGLLQTYVAGGIAPPGGSSFGAGSLDIPLQGDLDGDGKMDQILYRPSTGTWYVDESTGGFQTFQFGGPGDIPVVADFDGVGHAELGVYDPSTGSWYVAGHASAVTQFGGPSDVPLALANYYGNGEAIPAVYRESTGQWYVAGQSSPIAFGGPGDIPVPLYNYLGDGRSDLAVFDAGTSTWYVGGQATGIGFGGPGDIPIGEDFDGVGHDELGVYDPSTGDWYVGGHATAVSTFGGSVDIPVGAPYAYTALPGTANSIGALTAEFDPGISVMSLPAQSMTPAISATASAATTSSPSSNATDLDDAAGAVVVAQSATGGVAAAPKVVDPGEIHDSALDALQEVLALRRRRGNSSLLA